MSEKVLFVDDEPNVLAGYERQLRKRYALETAPGGEEGLAALAARGPFAVIVSDMRMPRMNGAQFLAEAKRRWPDSVRLLLTGQTDVQTAIEAVNHGSLFRFLTKPCSADDLTAALDAALAQYRLVTAERELLDKTLRGSVQVLGEVLALVNPTAFGRGLRVQNLIREMAPDLGEAVGWEVEVAAILSQLGYVGVPERVLALADRGKDLAADEQRQLDDAPGVAIGLIRRIPRLDRVIDVIANLNRRFDAGTVAGGDSAALPFGSRLLKLARDFDLLLGRGVPRPQAVDQLRVHPGRYDPKLLAVLEQMVQRQTRPESRVVPVHELTPDMILEEDLYSIGGAYLLRHGNTITVPLRLRLESMAASGQIPPGIRVLVPQAA